LVGFDERHAKRWEEMLKADPEAAILEACVRSFLGERLDALRPAEDAVEGGADFCCVRGGSHFYVEATCIKESTVTERIGLPPRSTTGAADWYAPLTEAVKNECVNKAKQCSKCSDAPCLLAIGTLHFQGGAICFEQSHVERILTSEPMITCDIDIRTGGAVGNPYQTTDLGKSAFLRRSQSADMFIEPARRSISGLLLCGFGGRPPTVNGVLHVEAVRPFDRGLLPGVPFCRLKEGYREGVFEVERC